MIARGEDYGFDANFGQGKIVAVRGGLADFLKHIHPLKHRAEDGVLPVEVGHGREADIELAAVRVFGGVDFVGEAGHGDSAFRVLEADLGGESPTGATSAGFVTLSPAARRIAGLDERAREGAVEAEAVVEFFLNEFFEILDGVGRGIIVEPDDHLSRLFFFRKLNLEDGDLGAEVGCGGGEGREDYGDQESGEGFHKIGNSRRSTSPNARPVSSATSKRGRLSNWRLRYPRAAICAMSKWWAWLVISPALVAASPGG